MNVCTYGYSLINSLPIYFLFIEFNLWLKAATTSQFTNCQILAPLLIFTNNSNPSKLSNAVDFILFFTSFDLLVSYIPHSLNYSFSLKNNSFTFVMSTFLFFFNSYIFSLNCYLRNMNALIYRVEFMMNQFTYTQ